MAILEKAEINIGDVVQFLHHAKDGIEHSLVVLKAEEAYFQHGYGYVVTLIDKDLKVLEGIPVQALKLIKGVRDGK